MAPMVTATLSSSSTTRRLPLGMLLRGASNWQRHAKGCAPTLAAAQFDRPTVCLDDALRDPQPEPSALFVLGREKRLENVWQGLLGDAVASVPDLNVHRV